MNGDWGRDALRDIARRGMDGLYVQRLIPRHVRPTMNRQATYTKAAQAA